MLKKTLIIILGVLLVTVTVSIAYAASVVSSKHDMRTYITDEPADTGVCVFCHTPHNASTTNITAPLWNRTDPASTYTIYTSTTLDATAGQPTSVSLACLSCHDGTIAVNAVINAPSGGLGTTFSSPLDASGKLTSGSAYLGVDLSNDHPVSLQYRDDADSGLRSNTANPTKVINGSLELPLFGSSDPYNIECGSCHAVHDPANTPFLRYPNTSSQLCTVCHVK